MLVAVFLGCTTPSADDSADPVLPVSVRVTLANVSVPGALDTSNGAADAVLAPGVIVVHDGQTRLFEEGQLAGEGMERVAEDGDPAVLVAELQGRDGVVSIDYLSAVDDATYEAAPMYSGELGYEVIDAPQGAVVEVVFMFAQSNDIFGATIAPIAVADLEAAPASGPLGGEGELDLTPRLAWFDAGTEANEEPGVGGDQAPRQVGPDVGTSTSDPIARIDGQDAAGWTMPPLADVARLSVSREP